MPKPVDRTETVDLHAPWWSPATESSGRYVERWVVRKHMTERNQQNIASAQEPRIRLLTGGKSSKQLGDEALAELMRTQMAFGRLYLLMEMTTEVTDENGTPQHLTREFYSGLATRDTQWVNEQLDALYTTEEVVPVLAEDEEKAERYADAAEAGAQVDPVLLDGRGVAQRRFRGTR